MTNLRSGAPPFALLLALVVLTAACTGGTDTSMSEQAGDFATSPSTTIPAGAGEDAPADDAGAPDSLGSGGVAPPLVQTAVDLGRDIIFTADMTVAVDDVAAASTEATQRIQALGGFLFGQQTSASPEPRSSLVFKVFPEDFQEALSRLSDLGELRDQRVSADDVTERVVDIRSRITTAEASVERLRGFLENATDVEAIADLENQLLQRETQLETLRGQLRTLEDAVSLATITVTLVESAMRPGVRVDVSAYSGTDDSGAACPGSASLTVDQRSEITMCFEIVNVGDTDLTGFTLRDPVLDVDADDLISVFGGLDSVLEPGESIVLAAHVTADRSRRTQTNVTALPVDEDGNVRQGRSVANTATISINAVDPGGVPGFGEGLERSLDALVTLGQLVVYLIAALIPFFWIPLGIWWLWRRRVRRHDHEEPAESDES
ncbi:MAG TPA: DUF4349 domain-containing protein [Acidimicrobiia bacterium]|nr:DUF4349 domain-containing protein [Acidimicrobiia bacterium]